MNIESMKNGPLKRCSMASSSELRHPLHEVGEKLVYLRAPRKLRKLPES